MNLLPVLILGVAFASAQDKDTIKAVGDLYGNQSKDPFNGLVEVTTKGQESFGPLEKCGKGSQQGIRACVPYNQCDGITNMIVQDGKTTGFGIIDIRFGENECEHYLDVCCGIPQEPDQPVSVSTDKTPIPLVTTSATSVRPPVTPVSPPVTPVSPVAPRPSSVFCGIRNPDGIDFKITGNRDNEAEYGEFPWMVAVLRTNYDPSTDNLALCGGSLIAPNIVLTGAHCVAGLKTTQYKVRAGEWDTQTTKERLPYQERDVVQAIIHEQFVPKILYNNVALLVLSRPFDQADNIGTICLPSQDERVDSGKCFVSGWGKDVFGKEGKFQVILKKIELPMVQLEPCQQALRKTRLGEEYQLHRSFICAGGQAGKDACTGDGGSPLVCPDPKKPSRYVQTGIVSWGIGCGQQNVPGVYADVAKVRNWVDNQLQRLNINTDSYNL